jgi:hypothetical protein
MEPKDRIEVNARASWCGTSSVWIAGDYGIDRIVAIAAIAYAAEITDCS